MSLESTESPETRESALPVLKGRYSYASVTDKIADVVLERPTHWGWFAGFGVSLLLTGLFVYAVYYLFVTGVGIWGVDIPVA
jgi:hypothetical protein